MYDTCYFWGDLNTIWCFQVVSIVVLYEKQEKNICFDIKMRLTPPTGTLKFLGYLGGKMGPKLL